jgi:tetratricopeptide (TPR) repeat protein
LGVGYGFVSLALNGQMVLSMMALLVVLKIVATSTCYASGNAGGIFGPSLFIGGMLGGAFGGAAHTLLPDYTASVGAYALIGMGTAFAGIVRVPLASVIMIFEITRDYTIIVPLMISNLLSYFISSRLQKTPIYEALLEQDGIHLPPGARDRQELMTVSQGSHPPPETLSAFETIEQAAARVSQNQESWPVIDQSGLLGMVTLAQMHSAIEAGRGNEPVSALLPQAEYQSDHTDGAGFPHLYSDDPLDTAMRRMAQYDLKVLPVVSRSNMRELKGVISVHDILEAYGLEGNGEPKVPSIPETKASTRVLVGILVIFAFAVALAAFLTNYYHAESAARAQQYFKQGNSLLAKDRDEEAIENFRNAVSISHTAQYRLALALALVKADRLSEAEIYLNELLRETPNSSLAHLGLARIKRAQGAIPEAIRQYHEAIYGSWPQNPTTDRLKARMELIEMLGQAGRREQAQAELLSLKAEKPPDLAMRKQIGQFFLRFGMPKESIEVFRDILKTAKTDPDALAGEGEAQLALGDLPAAQAALRSAVLHDPENRAYQTRLQFVDEVMVIDPAIHGLDAVERYRRSEKLLEATLDAFNQCVASQATQPPDAYRDTAAKAVKLLGNRGKPTSYTETAETAVALAQQLWQERLRLCGAPGSAGQALSQAIAQVSR